VSKIFDPGPLLESSAIPESFDLTRRDVSIAGDESFAVKPTVAVNVTALVTRTGLTLLAIEIVGVA
jgi:hypothetical protein